MQLKRVTIVIGQLLCISSFSQAVNSCEDKTFWQTWYQSGQFKGFGISPTKEAVAKAQYLFAENHYKGNLLTKDYKRALDLFKKAADAGLPQAYFRLGLMNHYGQGKSKDLKSAYTYYEHAAKINNPEAQFNLGLMNRYGIGWKREVVRKIVVNLFILSIQTHACMQLLAHAHAHARSRPRTKVAKQQCFARA